MRSKCIIFITCLYHYLAVSLLGDIITFTFRSCWCLNGSPVNCRWANERANERATDLETASRIRQIHSINGIIINHNLHIQTHPLRQKKLLQVHWRAFNTLEHEANMNMNDGTVPFVISSEPLSLYSEHCEYCEHCEYLEYLEYCDQRANGNTHYALIIFCFKFNSVICSIINGVALGNGLSSKCL